MKVGFDAKRYYHNHTGLGNYSRTIVHGLQRMYPENEYVLYDEKSLNRTFRLGHRAQQEACDIFHGLSNEIPFDLPRVSGGCHQHPLSIVTIHDVAWRTFPDMYHWADRQIYDWKYGSSCRRADRIVAISQSTRNDVVRFYGVPEEKVEIIYQPVQQQYYTPMDDAECDRLIKSHFGAEGLPPFLLYVGSINSRKNLLGVLQALAMIPADNRPFLLIVGNGREYRQKCEQYIHSHQLEKYIRIESRLHDGHLLQALYSRAMAFVYPSFYEGFGLPVVEAALQCTPVITTTVSSLSEAAGPDACLVDPHACDAVAQIAHHMQCLVEDRELAHAIGVKMESYSRKMFDPDQLTQQMMQFYKDNL